MTLPPEKIWAMQWKAAAPELKRIRDQELRNLDSHTGFPAQQSPYENGLVIWQRWMMRLALLNAYTKSQNRV
ncbi:MAG: hypothetical protein KF752_20110 [Pirellulaceae bacterium]|nr:hypothetical protein [Pirellulaceae bacterium]